jgi:hypothetical protein
MGKPIPGFECMGCNRNVAEINEYWFMLHNELWRKVCKGRTKGLLCVSCVELCLGRQLTPDDFNSALINSPLFGGEDKSDLLRERQGG